MSSRNLARPVAAAAAVVAVAIGGYAIGTSTSSSSATPGTATATATAAAQSTRPAQPGQPAQRPPLEQTTSSGQPPQGWSPGQGTVITGAAADKATAAAVAAHPEGTVNRVLKLGDGSYAVHRIGTTGQHHIFVSADFQVTGTS